MDRLELLQDTIETLRLADFSVYLTEGLRRYFDIIAVGDFRIFVKVLVNINNLSPLEGHELRKFAMAFSSASFVVGGVAGMEPLRDNTIYHRFGNPCSNLQTFRNIVTGETVSRFTKRGQLLVSIDGSSLKRLREERGLTQKQLAQALNCTPKTIYRIEKHNRVQEGLFKRLLDYFGRNIEIGSIELKEPEGKIQIPISDPLKRAILQEYFRLRLSTTPFQTPVDFVLEEKSVLTPVSRNEAELRSKQRIAKSLSAILGCGVLHITKEEKRRRIPFISFSELHSISSKEEILEKCGEC